MWRIVVIASETSCSKLFVEVLFPEPGKSSKEVCISFFCSEHWEGAWFRRSLTICTPLHKTIQ